MRSIPILLALLGEHAICAWGLGAQGQKCSNTQQNILSNHVPLCLEDSKEAVPSTEQYIHPIWSHPPVCVSKNGKEYCTYTTSKFRNHHGLSIISTPTAANAISENFQYTASARQISENTLKVKSIPGKGFGLTTTHPIKKGQTILLDAPRIIASAQFPSHIPRTQGSSLFAHAISHLPAKDRTRVLSLDKSLGGSDIEDVMKTNAFACQLHDGGEDDAYMCLFPSVARINHACRPNAYTRFVPKTLLMEVKALRDIKPGEEISISYGKIDLPHAERQALYKNGWNFKCTCTMCTSSAYEIAGSDQRRARFAKLQSYLENLSPETYDAQQIVAWEKEVIEISGKEGLEVLLAADYERLAYVHAGLGLRADARTWARKARESLLEWTVVEGGPDNEIRRVEELLGELGG